jgi:FHA domain-containing protein
MLLLTARVIHLNGQASDAVTVQLGAAGGSVGRDEKCDMVLPERWVSRVQARITRAQEQYVLHNASVSNPMYVNGMELSPGSSQAIADGDELQVGSYVIAVAEEKDGQPVVHSPAEAFAHADLPSAALVQAQIPHADSQRQTDPLLTLGTSGQDGASPFADLLAEAVPIEQNNELQSQPKSENRQTPLTSRMVAPFEPDLGNISTPQLATQIGTADELPLPGDNSAQISFERPVAEFQSNLLGSASSLDPNNPFGDLLAQALPIGNTLPFAPVAAPSAKVSDPEHGTVAPATSSLPASPMLSNASPNTEVEQHRIPVNPFALPMNQEAKAPKPYAQPLSALSGDPFADLMEGSIESHLAKAPAHPISSQGMTFIPEDFNPFAIGGVAQRNTPDPLTSLGRDNKGLADVQVNKTVDSIYSPSTESPTTLAVDPLAGSHARALQVGQDTDPMKLFANEGHALDALSTGNLSNAQSVSDHALEMASYFRVPAAMPDPAMLQEHVTESSSDTPPEFIPVSADPLLSIPQMLPAQQMPPGASAAKSAVSADFLPPDSEASLPSDLKSSPTTTSDGKSNEEYSIFQTSPNMTQSAGNSDILQHEPQPAVTSLLAVSQFSGTATEQPVSNKALDTENNQTLMLAFKRGAGLQDWTAQSLTPELMEILGQILQSAAQGVVSLLAARATVKQEIHLSVTLINPKANNPLKFVPDGHTALLQMMGPRMPGFMPPVDAMKEAFEDLVTHQTAIAAGTQATLEALFERFDPDSMESNNPQNSMSEKISQTLHHARLWNNYKNQYRQIKNEVQDDFFRRLGAEFHEAYHREYDRGPNDKP